MVAKFYSILKDYIVSIIYFFFLLFSFSQNIGYVDMIPASNNLQIFF